MLAEDSGKDHACASTNTCRLLAETKHTILEVTHPDLGQVRIWGRCLLDCDLAAGVTDDREVDRDFVLTVGHHIVQPAAVGVHLEDEIRRSVHQASGQAEKPHG